MFGNHESQTQTEILNEIKCKGFPWVIDTIEWHGVEQARYELEECITIIDEYEHCVLGYEAPEGFESVGKKERETIEAIIRDALHELYDKQESRLSVLREKGSTNSSIDGGN